MVIVTTHRVGLKVFFHNLMPFTTGANRFLPTKAARPQDERGLVASKEELPIKEATMVPFIHWI